MNAASKPLYLLATVKIRAGKVEGFCELMPRVVGVMERHGWRLVGAWTPLAGRMNVAIDLWQIPDANALPNGFAALMAALDWPDLSRALAECVEDEVIQLMSTLPFDPCRIPDRFP